MIDDSEAIVPADGGTNGTATVDNERKLGGLTITKSVEWNGITPDEEQEFEICITGPSYPTTPNCKTIGYDGGDLTWSNLIPGEYTVTESTLGSQWKTPVIDDSEAIVPTDGGTNGTATVDNERKLGSLKVTKTVDWNGVEPAGSFEICIEGPSYPAESEDPDACQTVGSDGGVLTWIDLIPGAYTVTETDPGNQWTVTVDDSLAVVPTDGGEGTATVDNEWNVGDLQILKSLSNPSGAAVQATFAIDYLCTIGEGEGTRYTKSGQVNVAPGADGETVEDIPMGATCTITEVTPSPVSGFTWAAVTYSPQSVEIAEKGGTFTVQANNAITQNVCTVNCTPPPRARAACRSARS